MNQEESQNLLLRKITENRISQKSQKINLKYLFFLYNDMEEKQIGKVFSYFSKIGVAAVKLSGKLKVGDKVRIRGATTDFEQQVDSMQIHNTAVKEAKKGDEIGIKVVDRVRNNDAVFLITK